MIEIVKLEKVTDELLEKELNEKPESCSKPEPINPCRFCDNEMGVGGEEHNNCFYLGTCGDCCNKLKTPEIHEFVSNLVQKKEEKARREETNKWINFINSQISKKPINRDDVIRNDLLKYIIENIELEEKCPLNKWDGLK
jgi:hypothetical protein